MYYTKHFAHTLYYNSLSHEGSFVIATDELPPCSGGEPIMAVGSPPLPGEVYASEFHCMFPLPQVTCGG